MENLGNNALSVQSIGAPSQNGVIIPPEADEDDDIQWEKLVDEIFRGNVIPVIGPGFLVSNDRDIHKILIDYFAKRYGVQSNPQTFSELVYDEQFLGKTKSKDKIYEKIFSIVEKMETTPNDSLKILLSTKVFPFIITTSFTPVAETAMKNVWGEGNVRILQFCNNPVVDRKEGGGDVRNEDDMKIPTVYYMFGKYGYEPHRYVVTDLDMMNFCKSWLSESNSPENLSNIIKKRYLLVLGNNYSDWQFRFIWYSMRSLKENQSQSSLVVSSLPKDSPLIQFLERLETITKNNPTDVVNEIVRRIEKRRPAELIKEIEKRIEKWKVGNTSNYYDVFLSYSRSDEAFTKKLYDKLKSKGLDVWFDKDSIDKGEPWKQKIVEGIKGSRIFVPILSTHIENEYIHEHEYRDEWRMAVSKSLRMGRRSFIIPLAEKGFDFYNAQTDVPDVFKKLNALWYDSESDMEAIAITILDKVNEIKKLEMSRK